MYKNFDELVKAVKASTAKRVLAVAAAEDEAVVDAALHAQAEGIAEPVFVGAAARIREILAQKTGRAADFDVVDAPEGGAGQRAVELIRDGSANILMKGLMETRDFLGPIVKKENGLRSGQIMSHVVFFGVPNYHKLLMTTDGGMVMYPTLEDKRHIIDNATWALRAMGYACPKHAVVCAIEKLNPKMQETVEAAELQRMNEAGEIRDCVVVGPISYDVAMDREIARHKGYENPHCGDFDCMIMPNMQAGNILGKCFTVTVGAPMAGIIVGAKAPAVMTSRGSDANEKFYSIAMAALAAAGAGR
ncbi:MAG: phosphate acyltransferase [Clostridia bacterium]|nr:phosphate acyltransferase [Clostridia bacterium]